MLWMTERWSRWARSARRICVPLLLGADTLTEAVATAIPSADREEKVSRTDRGSHILQRVQRWMPAWRRS
jgi:hypothetical protein